jgi:lysophospholipase L1-like esterase
MTTTKETTNKETKRHTDDMVSATKQFVTNTRTWATTVRDASWAPFISMVEQNEHMASTFRPWIDMTRTAHDRWLDLYETQTHEMIDRTYTVMDRFRP